MNWKMSKALNARHAVAVTGALLLMAGGVGRAQSEDSSSRNGLSGTWLVQITLRNCANQAPLGTFNSILSFHRGGTLSESTTSPVFAIGQRSPGHGNWASEGPRIYSERMVNLINFDTAANLPGTPGFNPSLPVSPGFFAGWAIISHTIELSDENHGTSAGSNEFYKADGTLYRSGCSTTVSTRFE